MYLKFKSILNKCGKFLDAKLEYFNGKTFKFGFLKYEMPTNNRIILIIKLIRFLISFYGLIILIIWLLGIPIPYTKCLTMVLKAICALIPAILSLLNIRVIKLYIKYPKQYMRKMAFGTPGEFSTIMFIMFIFTNNFIGLTIFKLYSLCYLNEPINITIVALIISLCSYFISIAYFYIHKKNVYLIKKKSINDKKKTKKL